MRKLTHQELLARQGKNDSENRIDLVVILNNIRSLHNVGSVFRTCDGAGVQKLYLCGITGHPPNNQISKTALDAENHVPWEYCEDIREPLRELKRQGYTIVFLEQTENSVPYQEFVPQGPVCLVLGNEIAGVSKDILNFCDQGIEIEMAGIKNSLNVSVAFGIVAYHLRNILIESTP